MNIYVNSKLQELPESAKITDALQSLNITARSGIAIAINNSVIPKTEWSTHSLQADDQLTLIKATQGG